MNGKAYPKPNTALNGRPWGRAPPVASQPGQPARADGVRSSAGGVAPGRTVHPPFSRHPDLGGHQKSKPSSSMHRFPRPPRPPSMRPHSATQSGQVVKPVPRGPGTQYSPLISGYPRKAPPPRAEGQKSPIGFPMPVSTVGNGVNRNGVTGGYPSAPGLPVQPVQLPHMEDPPPPIFSANSL